MLTTYDRRSAQCGQARAGKARHHNQIARLGHVAARGLGRCSRRGGHRFGVILLLVLVVGVALAAVLALLLSVLGLARILVLILRFRLLTIVLLLSGLVVLLLRARTLIGFGLLGSLVLRVALCGLGLFRGNLIRVVLVLGRAVIDASHQRRAQRRTKLHGERRLLVRRSNGGVRRLIRVVLGSIGIRGCVRAGAVVRAGVNGRIARAGGRVRGTCVGRTRGGAVRIAGRA